MYPTTNYNDRLSVSAAAATPRGATITCRHFAIAHALDPMAITHFTNPASIVSYFERNGLHTVEGHLENWNATPQSQKQLVANGQFGNWLADAGNTMYRKGYSSAGALLQTPDHVVAVRLEFVSAPQSAAIRVFCHDANVTTRQKVIEKASPDNLRQETLLGNFPAMAFQKVAANPDGMVVAAISPTLTLSPPGQLNYVQLNNHAQRDTLAAGLYAALQYNMSDAVLALATKARSLGCVGDAAKNLFARGESNHVTETAALYCAAQDKFTDVFRVAPNMLGTLGISGWEAGEVLDASHNGFPALNAAAGRGDAVVMQAIVDATLQLNRQDPHFRTTHARDVLEGRNAENVPAIHAAALSGRLAAYAVIAKGIQDLGLSQQQRVDMLHAKDDNDTPALWTAVASGNANAYGAMADAINKAGIHDAREVQALLLAKNAAGIPAHHQSTINGTLGAYTALGNALRATGISGREAQNTLSGDRHDRVTTEHLLARSSNQALRQEFEQVCSRARSVQDNRTPQHHPNHPTAGGSSQGPARPFQNALGRGRRG